MLRLAYGTFLLTLAVAVHGCTDRDATTETTVEKNLVSDVQILRKTEQGSEVDVAELAAKYFPLGSSRTQAEAELNRLGFTAYPLGSQSGTQQVVYSNYLRRWLLGEDEIRVILTYTDSKVSKVQALLFYHFLL
jgi:hypothetical protein